MAGILTEYYPEDVEAFKNDLFLMMGIVHQIDVQYGAGETDCVRDIEKFKKFAYDWNLKYKNLIVRVVETQIQFSVRLLVNEQDLKRVFLDALIKIGSMSSVNSEQVGIDFLEEKNIRRILRLIDKKIDVSYVLEGNENTLTLEYDDTYERARIIYDKADIVKENSPEFLICAYYALKEVNRNIDLQKHGDDFSFDTDIEERDGKGDGWDSRIPLFSRSQSDNS